MSIHAYLNFSGNAAEVIGFYKTVFDTDTSQIMYFKDMPPDPSFPVPDEIKNYVMHAAMDISGSTVMFSDAPPGMPLNMGNNVSLLIMSKDSDALTRYYGRLLEGGTVVMPLAPTFFSKLYANVVDKFGICWQLYLEE